VFDDIEKIPIYHVKRDKKGRKHVDILAKDCDWFTTLKKKHLNKKGEKG